MRVKLITAEFVDKLLAIDTDFQTFSQTGIAAKISNLQSCYSMFVNSLDRQPDKKQKIIALAATNSSCSSDQLQ